MSDAGKEMWSQPGHDDSPNSPDPKVDMIANTQDIGATMYAKARNLDSDDLEGELLKVKRKIDRILMPLVSRFHIPPTNGYIDLLRKD